MKNLLLVAIAMVLSVASYATTTSTTAEAKAETTAQLVNPTESIVVHGTILDALTAENLAGATITINGKKIYSDFDGCFALPFTAGRPATVKISLISYQDMTFTVDPKDSQDIKIALEHY
ncbi:MAG: carboxypeptidase-like regulatory domain-containing protein [bacterium]